MIHFKGGDQNLFPFQCMHALNPVLKPRPMNLYIKVNTHVYQILQKPFLVFKIYEANVLVKCC